MFVTYYYCPYVFFLLFFFFKQKTAYEMRISDWSSDVCSSDLDYEILRRVLEALELPCGSPAQIVQSRRSLASRARQTSRRMVIVQVDEAPVFTQTGAQIGRASCRERVCQYV